MTGFGRVGGEPPGLVSPGLVIGELVSAAVLVLVVGGRLAAAVLDQGLRDQLLGPHAGVSEIRALDPTRQRPAARLVAHPDGHGSTPVGREDGGHRRR